MKNLFLVTFAFIPIQAKFSWDLHPDDWNPPMMEKRMLNTHPELFNSDYEVEFPFDDNQIVKRLDYEDIPMMKRVWMNADPKMFQNHDWDNSLVHLLPSV